MYNIIYLTKSTNNINETVKTSEAGITYNDCNIHHAMRSISRNIQNLQANKTEVIKTIIINLLLWRVFLTFLVRGNHKTRQRVSGKLVNVSSTEVNSLTKINRFYEKKPYNLFIHSN